MTIGERIKQIRKENKLNQLELAEILEKKQSVISKIEKNETSITVESLIVICEKFKRSADWILFGREMQTEINTKDQELNSEGQKMLMEYIEYLKQKYPAETYEKNGNLYYPGSGEKIG